MERGVEFDVIEYIKTPPSVSDLTTILTAVTDPPDDLVRKDKRFRELGLDAENYVDAGAVVEILRKHPELMQRPVVLSGKRAVLARPPEKLLELL